MYIKVRTICEIIEFKKVLINFGQKDFVAPNWKTCKNKMTEEEQDLYVKMSDCENISFRALSAMNLEE